MTKRVGNKAEAVEGTAGRNPRKGSVTPPQNRAKTGDRNATGRFRKGVSGNPGGRPHGVEHVTVLARERTETAIATLTSIMQDADAPHAARVRAAEALLNRGWGSPVQAHEIAGEPVEIRLTYADKGL